MNLTIHDVAEALQVPEATVLRWVSQRNLPAVQVNGAYHVNRVQLLEWAALNRLPLASAAFRPNGVLQTRLDRALEAGKVVDKLAGTDKPTVLRALIDSLPLPPELQRDEALLMFSSRESLGSTAIGEGFALPHPRQPIVTPGHPPSITLCYLAQPLDFNAPDGQPVHTLFAMLSPTVRVHVHLLARLMTALRDPGFRDSVRLKEATAIIAEATRIEESYLTE